MEKKTELIIAKSITLFINSEIEINSDNIFLQNLFKCMFLGKLAEKGKEITINTLEELKTQFKELSFNQRIEIKLLKTNTVQEILMDYEDLYEMINNFKEDHIQIIDVQPKEKAYITPITEITAYTLKKIVYPE